MSDTVVGIGHQKTIRTVIDRISAEITRTQGQPRKIIAQARGVQLVGERKDYDGPYVHFELRLKKVGADVKSSIEQTVEAHPDCCALTQQDGEQVVTCSRGDGVDAETFNAALDAVSSCMTLPEVWHIKGDNYRADHVSIERLFQAMIQYKASDLHLAPGETPVFRVDSQTRHSEIIAALSGAQIMALIREITTDQYWTEFTDTKQTSFNFHQIGLGYSRVSAFMKGGAPHLTFRFLPEEIPSFEELQIPKQTMEHLANLHHGMVLLCGMTGSGKSTTVAAMIDWINQHNCYHILTIENPIEYVHRNKKSMISQRSTGLDVLNFGVAVTGALRHDPDVLLIGEMRDADTIRSGINAAATGHLVISTLHASTAYDVVNRIASFFDPVERDLVRIQLRECIRCIICQRLLPRKGGGRLPAIEVLFNDIKPITDCILTGDTDGIRIGMQQTTSHSFIFETYIHRLYKDGLIDLDVARAYCTDQSIFDQMIMGTYSVPRLDSIKSAHMGHV